MKALAVGGIEDHIHALLSLPATMSFAKAVQLIKGGSSKWVHQTFPKLQQFAWQDGYGAFSLAGRNLEKPLTIFKSRKSIIESEPFRRNSWNYLIGTASNTIADMFTK